VIRLRLRRSRPQSTDKGAPRFCIRIRINEIVFWGDRR
jgi:hypothetical protein